MIKLENFERLEFSGISYGGHGGSKKGVIINGERWFLKYPKSTKSMDVEGISYSTTPLSEYLGSHIYESIGIDTHKTMLGYSKNKLVVACKDFLSVTEVLFDYNMLKNEYDENIELKLEELSSLSQNKSHILEEVELIMKENHYFDKLPELKTRFWDMFVVDAFLSNNDRNEGNWGLILDKSNGNLRIAPVFDNGASFYNKSSNTKLKNILNNEKKFEQSVYDSCISIYRENDKIINPLKYIESMKNDECNKAILRIVPKIDMKKIEEIFNELPSSYNGIEVLSKEQKELYFKSLQYKYNKVLLSIYNKLI